MMELRLKRWNVYGITSRVRTRCRKLKKNVKGLGGRGRLTNATIDRLQNYFGLAQHQHCHDLKVMQSACRESLFHVASSKDGNYHNPHCPSGTDSWCKHNKIWPIKQKHISLVLVCPLI